MEKTYHIPSSLPTLNEYINAERTNRYKAAEMKRTAEKLLMWHIKMQGIVKMTKPVRIEYKWIMPDRKKDKDNIAFAKKFIQDALVKMKVLANDGWNNIDGFTDAFEIGEKAEVIIKITEVQTYENDTN